MRELKILTWHVHGNYLYYLSQVPHRFYVPVQPGRPFDYVGIPPGFPWGDNIQEVPAGEVKDLDLDCILFQRQTHYRQEQYALLTERQRQLPRIYLEHDPPQEHPTATRHMVDDPEILLVHVTPFNALMWDNGRTPAVVIDHGVTVPDGVAYSGEIERGVAVVNNMKKRGRRLGADVFAHVRTQVPLDLAGMGSEEMGGVGEVKHELLASFESRYRFFFNPIRYTSLGLAVCEAMMLGMPIIGLATTEMVTAVENGVAGYVDTDPAKLIARMRELLADRDRARLLGEGARRYALTRFNICRFADDWNRAFSLVTGQTRRAYSRTPAPAPLEGNNV